MKFIRNYKIVLFVCAAASAIYGFIFLGRTAGIVIMVFYFLLLLTFFFDWVWLLIKGVLGLVVGGGVAVFVWYFLTDYSPNTVHIFAPRKMDWELLLSGHLNYKNFKENDTLRIWSRSDFELKLKISQKQSYWDSLQGGSNFNKYINTNEPEYLQKPKNLRSYSKKKEELNKQYATTELGVFFPGDVFNYSYAYSYVFLKPVDCIIIKTHPDSLLAYNVGLSNYRTEKWGARALASLFLLISLIFTGKQFVRIKKEVLMQDYDIVSEKSGGNEISVAVPRHYDLNRIRQDLLKYSVDFDSPLLKLYINSVFLRFKQKQQQKNIYELIESLNLGIKYMETVMRFRETEIDFSQIDARGKITKAENDLKLTQLETERNLVIKRAEKEMRDLEEDGGKNSSSSKPPQKSEREIILEKLDQEHQFAIRKMTSEMDKMMAAIRICDQIKKERPQDGEQICDDLFRVWHEKGILHTDR